MEDAEKVVRYPANETAVKHARIGKGASRVFRERGFENVSAGEVMKAAGLTHGAVLCPCILTHLGGHLYCLNTVQNKTAFQVAFPFQCTCAMNRNVLYRSSCTLI
jgi:hypothetical protein